MLYEVLDDWMPWGLRAWVVYYLNGIGMYEDLAVGQDEGNEWICS